MVKGDERTAFFWGRMDPSSFPTALPEWHGGVQLENGAYFHLRVNDDEGSHIYAVYSNVSGKVKGIDLNVPSDFPWDDDQVEALRMVMATSAFAEMDISLDYEAGWCA